MEFLVEFTVEPSHKAMIVISQPWEFVPKGSSHFNYHTGSGNNKIDNKNANNCTIGTESIQNQQQSQNHPNQAQFFLQKSHLNRVFSSHNQYGQRKTSQLIVHPEDNNSSINEFSFSFLNKSPLINNINFDMTNEKWHLEQINEFCENEIYIKDNKVILSYGSDNDSKIVKRIYTFDSPIFDCNWFNFKTDSNDDGIIRDALCIFELQKLHVYFQNGSDFHIQLPFKLKNCWKLKDAILLERQSDYNNLNTTTQYRPNHTTQILFTLSNPLEELKPILCKNGESSKGIYLRENSKQIIIGVVESLNLVLVFSLLNNVHYIYRINEYISEDSQAVNNLLNNTNQSQSIKTDYLSTNTNTNANLNVNNLPSTPLARVSSGNCLSMSINHSRKRLSVSPIISTYSFYNKLNSPSVNSTNQQQNTIFSSTFSATTTSTTTNQNLNNPTMPSSSTSNNPTSSSSSTLTTTTTLVSAHQHYFQRNFSPMATLSRSPSCSSSPAVAMSSVRRNTVTSVNSNLLNANQYSTSNTTLVANKTLIEPTNLRPTNSATFMTPSIEVNSHPYNFNQFKTPLNVNYQQQNTPINNYRRNFTPQLNNSTINPAINTENLNESIYEQMSPEYCLEFIWTEPMTVAGDSSFNEKATKFFHISDLYNQKYVCYLMPVKSQLRCIKIDYNPEFDVATPVGSINYIPAKDAVFVESRNLMIILDNQGSLFAYSGLTKLCKLQLHNIIWCNPSTNLNMFSRQINKDLFQSPIVTPIKSKLFSNNLVKPTITANNTEGENISIDDSSIEKLSYSQHNTSIQQTQQFIFKTPKHETGSLISKALINSSNVAATASNNINNILPQQQEFKSITDSTGSRFSVKFNDNRLVRVNLNESSSCKLVNICLEAFKYTLNKEIYYEIVQQWYIHRYTISGESLRDQLNVFLYLILNLCGCFDMSKIEQELPFLFTNHNANLNANKPKPETNEQVNANERASENTPKRFQEATTTDSLDSGINEDKNQKSQTNAEINQDQNCNAKRAKCFYKTSDNTNEGTSDDWEFLMNDDLLYRLVEGEKNFSEAKNLNSKAKIQKIQPKEDKSRVSQDQEAKIKYSSSLSSISSGTPINENIKTSGYQFTRQKRPIASTTGSMFSSAANISSISTGGVLFPYLKHILYTLHIIYEETKLYRSLQIYVEPLIQILYLLANELNLPLYINYYEQEYPLLLKLKSSKLFGSNTVHSSSSTSSFSSNSIPLKNSSSSHLSNIINQEPPVLHKFLLKLIETPLNGKSNCNDENPANETIFINPFPIIGSVTKRIIKTIKIYALIALCTKPELKKINYNDFLNQLFFKINFSGFQQDLIEKNQLNNSFQSFPYYTLKFNFKPGDQYIYENIFSLCLEMGLCTLNEIYDYPLAVLIPILESIHWCRENPCFSWPSYAFDLIGRNDLSILKANSDLIALEGSQSNFSNSNTESNDEEAEVNPMLKQQSSITNFNKSQSINHLTLGKKRISSSRSRNAISNNNDLNNHFQSDNNLTLHVTQNVKKEDEDGMQHIMQLETIKCRFNEDLRIKEVRSCLQTTRPIQIKLNQGPDVSDHDFVEEEEKFLACICLRTMSLPVARGIFTLHTINPIPTEPVVIPELNLKGKSVTKKTTIDLTRVEIPNNMTYWPLFHNGVASGLTINAQAKDLSNAWIKSHLAKNFELTNEQAGFLYGLGLTGHLANFSMLNVHDALTRRHDLTNIAILLGLAASKIGSMDLSVTRLISMHIKALMPPVEIELEIPYNIQIAALLSLGLVYVKSANKHISYVLLKEIGRLPGNEIDKDLHSLDREAYSLTAGLALGMILLEKGKKSLTIMDSTFTDELYHYMVGGHKEKYLDGGSFSNQVGNYQTSGFGGNNSAVNPSGVGAGGEHNFPGSANFTGNFRNSNSSYIREGESINTNITCPGATLALGLIYFNSCDKLISEWFSPPDSAFLLDSIRPDFLLLRTVARNLIMWKYILPTQSWLINQLSNLLKSNLKSDKILSDKFSSLILNDTKPIPTKQSQSKSKKPSKVAFKFSNNDDNNEINEEDEYLNSSDETNDDVELIDDTDEDNNIVIQEKKSTKKSNTKSKHSKAKHTLGDLIEFDDVEDDFFPEPDEEVCYTKKNTKSKKKDKSNQEDNSDDDFEDIGTNFDFNSESSSSQSNNLIDEDTKTEAFRHIIAGACMSMGLKFAGTSNNEAYKTLLFWAKYFTNLNDTKLSTENCLCVVVLSLSMVMAGSGDLEVLRLCRYLRSRVGPNLNHVLYGSQMAINMALSLLFMGGGRYTLKTDSLSVALMLCAFYPHFPVDSNDNRFHLQAFRHLYVLASESRLLLSKDVDTNEFCYVPVEITLKPNEHHNVYKYQQMAPCLLPELNRIQELKILGPRYYQIRFKDDLHFNELKNILLSELLVKQKNGYFSYFDDPNDEKAFNIRNILNKIIVPHKITPDLLEQITNEDHINLFAKMLNKSNENEFNHKTNRLLKIIYESVVQETFDFVGVMLLIEKEVTSEPTSTFIQQIKLVNSFYKSLVSKNNHIINQEFLHLTISSLESKLREKLRKQVELIRYYINNEYKDGVESLIYFSILNDINKSEFENFIKCESFVDILKSSSKPENSLKLYQLFRN